MFELKKIGYAVAVTTALGVYGSAMAATVDITTAYGVGADATVVGLGGANVIGSPANPHTGLGDLSNVNFGGEGFLYAHARNKPDDTQIDNEVTYLRFQLPGDVATVTDARLDLYWERPGDSWDWYVHGLNESASYGAGSLDENWDESAITWNNAPGNDLNGDKKGSDLDPAFTTELWKDKIVSMGGVNKKSHTVSVGPDIDQPAGNATGIANLVNFLNADTNGVVTLIVVSQDPAFDATYSRFLSKETDGIDPRTGLAYGGAGHSGDLPANGTLMPLLYIEYTPVPEPASLALAALGGLAVIGRRRA